jgi:antitoxin StbD
MGDAMHLIRANKVVSVTDLKKNPAQVVNDAGDQPVAVLSHNKPAFYLLAPDVFERLLERLDDADLIKLARTRMKEVARAVTVDIDRI